MIVSVDIRTGVLLDETEEYCRLIQLAALIHGIESHYVSCKEGIRL
jgi:hypothetical protein